MRILFTGGGTAGHILPNIAVIDELRKNQQESRFEDRYDSVRHESVRHEFFYAGSSDGPEMRLAVAAQVPFYPISCGKIRRYFSWESALKNFVAPFQTGFGFFQALALMRRLRPDVVFSKGGYVSVPVVMAAWTYGARVVLHESDVSPGLSNRLCARFADIVCVAWPETQKFFSARKTLVTGIPVRRSLFDGDRTRGLSLCGFGGSPHKMKPVLLVMGGSLGAEFLNRLVEKMLPELLEKYDVVHITGRGKKSARADFVSANSVGIHFAHYKSFEYLDRELADIYAAADLVLGRAGANSLAEIAALKKPSVLIPLGHDASRGDQILNAEKFEEIGAAVKILQKDAAPKKVLEILLDLAAHPDTRAMMGARAYDFGARCVRSAEIIADLPLWTL